MNEACSLGDSIPAWITSELVESTIRTWEPYYPEPLTAQDAIHILLNVAETIDTP